MKKQQGAAAIWFVLIFAALASITALGIEGSRYLTYKARLGDALETSSLLLAADQAERELKLNGEPKKERIERSHELVKQTIQAYLKDTESFPEVKASVIPQRAPHNGFSYRVAATTRYNSWMSYASAPSFGPTQDIANFAAAAKQPSGSAGGDNGDVVLVVDHSMSMNQNTCTQTITPGIRRLQSAKVAVTHQMIRMFIEQIRKPDTQDESKQGRLALVPFENGTRSQMRSGNAGQVMCENHLVFKSGGGAGYGEFNWRQQLKKLQYTDRDSPAAIAKGKTLMQPYVERALFTENKLGRDKRRVDDWLPFNAEEVDIRATIQGVLSGKPRNSNADLPVDGSRAVTQEFNRICRGNMQTVGFGHPFNKGPLSRNGHRYDPYTHLVRRFNSGSAWQPAMDGVPGQYLGSWTSSFQGILGGAREVLEHKDDKPLLFVLVVGGHDTPNANSKLNRMGKDYHNTPFRQDQLTKALISGGDGLFAKLRARHPHIRFALVKLQPDNKADQFTLNYESAFDTVVNLPYQKASGNTEIGECKNMNVRTNDYDFDQAELKGWSDKIAQLLQEAGQAYGRSANGEVGGLIDRHSRP